MPVWHQNALAKEAGELIPSPDELYEAIEYTIQKNYIQDLTRYRDPGSRDPRLYFADCEMGC